MTPRAFAERSAVTDARIKAVIAALAERSGVEAPVFGARPGNVEPQVARLREREAIADFLEGFLAGLGAQPGPVTPESLPSTRQPAMKGAR